MSERTQVLGWTVDGQEAAQVAARVRAWLVAQGVVEALPTDSGLTFLVYRPGPRALEAVAAPGPRVSDFRTLASNGVELSYAPRSRLLVDGDNLPGVACPACGAEVGTAAVVEWMGDLEHVSQAAPHVVCESCGKSLAPNDLAVTGGAFANVVLRFWNWWPLKRELIAELSQIVGARCVVFYERI